MITFDPATKRIILDSSAVTATEIYSRWVDWAATSDNAKYGMVFRQVGGDDLDGGLSIPPYYFLQSGWRVRPMESDHTLTITGNLFVEGGGVPVVRTLGSYQVNVNYTVPVQAQGIATGGSGGLTSGQAALLDEIAAKVQELYRLQGLDPVAPLVVSETARQAGGSITQTINSAGGVTTVQRL